jgi:hypothetical protein
MMGPKSRAVARALERRRLDALGLEDCTKGTGMRIV